MATSRLSNLLHSLGRKLLGLLGWKTETSSGHFMLAYAILVSEEVHNYMRRLQVEILQKYGANREIQISPHITLKQGFAARDLDPLERYFDRLAAEIEPFEITVRNIGFFDDGVIFMDVAQNGPLDSLRRRVVQDLLSEFGVKPNELEDDRYHFHATLAHGLSLDSFEQVRRELEGVRVEFRFVCDTLALLYRTGGAWITYKRSAIGATKPRQARP